MKCFREANLTTNSSGAVGAVYKILSFFIYVIRNTFCIVERVTAGDPESELYVKHKSPCDLHSAEKAEMSFTEWLRRQELRELSPTTPIGPHIKYEEETKEH